MHAVDIKRVDLSSIEAGLEHTLKQVREGKFPYAQACVIVFGRQDGATATRAYGVRSSPLEIDGWLARALYQHDNDEDAPKSGSAT